MLEEPDQELLTCIRRLSSLKEGPEAARKLVEAGSSSIPLLRDFLLFGEPGVVYQPRRWAVEALGKLGAKEVLIEYLTHERRIANPAVQFAEEAVKSAAALQLLKWPTRDVIDVLLETAEKSLLPGALEALGKLKWPEAIPMLVEALEDDLSRPVAEVALRNIGCEAEQWLIEAATTPRPDHEWETPSSLRRRRSVLRLLYEMRVSGRGWEKLRSLLKETDEEFLVLLFKIAGALNETEDQRAICRKLINGISEADWLVKDEIEEAFVKYFEIIEDIVEVEISSRFQNVDDIRDDPVLRILLSIKHKTVK